MSRLWPSSFIVLFSCLPLVWLSTAVAAPPPDRTGVRVMFIIQDVDPAGISAVETTLSQAFQQQGYQVLDRQMVAQTLQREAELLRQYDVEAAKQLGSRLSAHIVISGKSRTRVQEKTYSSLGGKKVTISQANISAKAIVVSTGKIVGARNAHARKPFDASGDLALETAAEQLGGQLVADIESYLTRDTTDYRLVVLNLSHNDALSMQQVLRTQVQGVRKVLEHGFSQNTLELDISVAKQDDLDFKRRLFTGFPKLGMGRFEILAREGASVYLHKTGAARRPSGPRKIPPSGSGSPRNQPDQPKQKPLPPTTEKGNYRSGYRKRWAVIIGINEYQRWPKLAYAVKDAEEIRKRLLAFNFDEIISILDHRATQKNILRVLGDELYEKTDAEDQVFIFFAGHGQTQDLPNGQKMGYIIPVDGDVKNYYSTAISMTQLRELSDRLQAKHIFYAMDSCFSGLLLRLRGSAPAQDYTLKTQTRVRQVLTAGSEGEEVVEVEGHGLFTRALLQGLDGQADLNSDGHITANELSQFVTPRILQVSQNTQNPLFGRIDLGRGDFVFTPPQ